MTSEITKELRRSSYYMSTSAPRINPKRLDWIFARLQASRALGQVRLHLDLPGGENWRCALCDVPISGFEGAPARQKINDHGIPFTTVAWCTLEPCGHTYLAPGGGLIH